MKQIFPAAILVLILFAGRADAYIDPGSGSYLLQLLTAGFFAAIFALKIFWSRIKSFVTRTSPKGGEDAGEPRS